VVEFLLNVNVTKIMNDNIPDVNKIPNVRVQLELFRIYSKRWKKEMPVTLIEWEDGTHDLHCQTGDHHIEAIEKAERLLFETLGLRIKQKDYYFTGPTGVYYPLERCI